MQLVKNNDEFRTKSYHNDQMNRYNTIQQHELSLETIQGAKGRYLVLCR